MTAGEGKVLVAFRTHIWDAAVEAAFQALRRSTQAEIVLCADETNGVVEGPPGLRKLAHTRDTFSAMGLPLLPSPEQALWFCSDYPLFHLLEHFEFDAVFMIEGDAGATGPVDAMFARLFSDGADYASGGLRRRSERYPYRGAALEWFGPRHGTDTIWSGSFAAVFLSRRAVEALRAERLAMAEAASRQALGWSYGEAFVATCLQLGGFRCRRLNNYADLTRFSWEKAVRPDEITWSEEGEVRLFHPVLDSPRYEQKLLAYYRRRDRRYADQSAETKAAARELARSFAEFEAASRKLAEQARALRQLRSENRRLRLANKALKEKARFWRPRNWPGYGAALLARLRPRGRD